MKGLRPQNQYQAIRTQQEYHELIASGMAWELFPALEPTWEEFRLAQEKFNLSTQPEVTPDGTQS